MTSYVSFPLLLQQPQFCISEVQHVSPCDKYQDIFRAAFLPFLSILHLLGAAHIS